MIALRGFQPDTIAMLRQAVAKLRALARRMAVLLVSPTGSGKTVMFAYLTSALVASGKRVVLLAHREELLAQISATLRLFDVVHGLIGSGAIYNRGFLAHVAGVMSLVRRLDAVDVPDYVIVDEAHHGAEGSSWHQCIEYWRSRNPALVVIGVTATPERLDGAGLGATFEEIVIGPDTAAHIDAGWLSPFRLFGPPEPIDMTGLRRRYGEVDKAEVEARVDKPKITGNVIAHYQRYCDHQPIVPFCVSIKHAEHVAEEFAAAGYKAATIDGRMDKKTRRERVRDFGTGRLEVLTSCDLISEGFDVPGIVAVANLRYTESLALALQQWGRALRPIYAAGDMTTPEGRRACIAAGSKPHAFIFDHVGLTAKHGFPDDERQWSLSERPRSKREKDPDDVAVKQCRACAAWNRGNALVCCECREPFGTTTARTIEVVDGELVEKTPEQRLRTRQMEVAMARDLPDAAEAYKALVELGKARGYPHPLQWARHQLDVRKRAEITRTGGVTSGLLFEGAT